MAAPKIKPIKVGEKTRYRWVVDIGYETVIDAQTGKSKLKRKQLTRTYDRRKDAERELAKVLNKTNNGTYAAPSKLTVSEYLDVWIRSATRGREKATQANYRYALLPAREMFGAKPLQKLTTVDVENLIDHMLTGARKRGGKVGTGLSPRSVQLTLSRLRSALNDAVLRHLIEFNVAAPVKCPSQTSGGRVPWSPAEVKVFLDSLVGQRLQAPVLLSLMGLRPAETCGLRWAEDVDLDAEAIRVGDNTRTLVYDENGATVVEKEAKSAAGKRELPLPKQVTAALKAFKALLAKEKLAAGEAYESSGYLLVDELGSPFKTDQLRRAMHKLMAEAGVRKVRPYDARHACLTFLRMSGVPGPIVSAWAGHGDLTIADRVYVHPSAKDLEQGRDKLAELLG